MAIVSVGVWQVSTLPNLPAAHASGTCTPVAAPSADVAPSNGFSTVSSIVATFDHARSLEGCTVPLGINQSTFGSASSQQQMYMLFNAERVDRGLPSLRLDSTLLSQIDLNHSQEMAHYGYFNHPSPINQPGPSHVFNRLTVNPGINGHWSALGENIAAGFSTAAAAAYAYMYQDSASGWGHRQNILGYIGGTFGHYNWVGVGISTGGAYGIYYTSDFLQNGSSPYTPPSTTDTLAPTLHAPVVVSGKVGGTVTVETTGVKDTGAAPGAAGVTGVVFYVNHITMDSYGNANTVVATQTSSGTWTATLTLPSGATLHAVAVDGSGNYSDCAASGTCVAAAQLTSATLSGGRGSSNLLSGQIQGILPRFAPTLAH